MKLVLLLVTIVALTGAPAHAQSDAADSLYRAGRRALSDKDYSVAARTFDVIVSRHPRSSYAPDALYWRGFALYRLGELDHAHTALQMQLSRFPRAATHSDAEALLIAVKGELAKRGSPEARRDVDRAAAGTGRGCEDMELQAAALGAVQQMDAERAVPLLRRVVARRDDCSIPLRRNAVFILAQRGGADRERILLDVARSDPSPGVRKDAVFHLSSAKSERAVDALRELLNGSDPAVRSDALFSLAQMRTDRARNAVRDFAVSSGAPPNLRRDAFFHLAQNASEEDLRWLRQAYGRVNDAKLRSDLLFHIASKPSPETSRWLLGVAMDEREAAESRRSAVFFIAQRPDDAALDALITVAKRARSNALRKDAMFHLGHSKDARAAKALEEIVVP